MTGTYSKIFVSQLHTHHNTFRDTEPTVLIELVTNGTGYHTDLLYEIPRQTLFDYVEAVDKKEDFDAPHIHFDKKTTATTLSSGNASIRVTRQRTLELCDLITKLSKPSYDPAYNPFSS